REGQPRLELSDFVGQFKDEIVDEYGLGARITTFFANAPKSYGYVVQLLDGSVKMCSKLKGIMQNVNCLNQFSLQDMLDAIVACSGKEFVITEPRKIARDKKNAALYNRTLQKTWCTGYDKHVVMPDGF
ncbi:hypothetical protein, partial [Pseudoalteromonas sp.]|uniref:hypothetical protein n=1 Tax=Pseudoalteromonas sp. TaxID=53249 RepID=UPI0026231F80